DAGSGGGPRYDGHARSLPRQPGPQLMPRPPNRGRHASASTSRFDRPTLVLIAVAVVALVAGGFGLTRVLADGGGGTPDADAATTPVVCGFEATVSVAAAPEVAAAVQLAAASAPDDACVTYEVSAQPARDVATAIEAGR